MTRKSPREIEHDIRDLGGGRRPGRPPGDPSERYARYQADARQRWDADDYPGPDDGGPLLRLWDAYALAYDDAREWARVRSETISTLIAEDPRPEHVPPAPDGYDGALPVPTDDVRDAIAGFESIYAVSVKRLSDPDDLAELPDAVDPDLLADERTQADFAEFVALAHDLY